MTPLVVVATLAFAAGAAVGYRLARAVMARFVADALAALGRPPDPPARDESPVAAVLRQSAGPVIRPTRSPFGERRHKLPPA